MSPQRHERVMNKLPKIIISIQALLTEGSALAWMAGQQKPPKHRDNADLPGLGNVNAGFFGQACKPQRRCEKLYLIPI